MSDDAGAAKAGNIDNTTINGMLSYALGGHKVSAAWQQLSGDSAFPYVDGATRTWSTSSRSTTSPVPTSVPGRRVTTTTLPRSAYPA